MAKEEPFTSEDVSCDQCEQVFPNLPKLMAHIRKAEGHEPVCKLCDIPFKNFHNLRHHKRVYHIQKMTEHVCEDCGKSFPNALAARSHWNFVHKIEDDLLCNICGTSCQNMKKLKKHTQMCLAKEPEVIDKLIKDRPHIEIDSIFLKKSFEKYLKESQEAEIKCQPTEDSDSDNELSNKSDQLDDSIVKKEPSDIFEYEVSHLAQSELNEEDQCEKAMDSKVKQESKDSNMKSEDESEKLDVKPRVPSMVCPFCSKEVKFFKRHMKTKHSEIPEELYLFYEKAKTKKTQQPKTSQICPICAVEVKYLDRHIQTQHNGNDTKEFKCNECGKAFKNQYNLKDHKYAAHRKEPSMCEICSKVFKNPHALKGHVRLYHEAKEEQTCLECNNTFETKMKLYFHMRAVHTVEHAKCEYCGKSYKNKSLLKKHQRVSHPPGKDLLPPIPLKSDPVEQNAVVENVSLSKPSNAWKEIKTSPEVKKEDASAVHSPLPQNLSCESWPDKPVAPDNQCWGASRDSEDVKREVSSHIQSLAQALCDGQRPEHLSSNNLSHNQYWAASRSPQDSRREMTNPIHALAQALTDGQRAENLTSSSPHAQYWAGSRESQEVKREALPHLAHLPQHLAEGSWSERFTQSNHSNSWTPSRPTPDMNFSPYYSSPSPNLTAPASNWGRLATYPGQIPPNIWKNWWTPPPSQP